MSRDEPGYSLILLDVGDEAVRIARATIRVRRCGSDEALQILSAPLPMRVATGLTPQAAREGQWEFVSCDCVAIFVRDDVVDGGGSAYLRTLFETVGSSPEFAFVGLELESVPDDAAGADYLDRFLGASPPRLPARLRVREQKARLMEAFADEIGAVVRRERGGS